MVPLRPLMRKMVCLLSIGAFLLNLTSCRRKLEAVATQVRSLTAHCERFTLICCDREPGQAAMELFFPDLAPGLLLIAHPACIYSFCIILADLQYLRMKKSECDPRVTGFHTISFSIAF